MSSRWTSSGVGTAAPWQLDQLKEKIEYNEINERHLTQLLMGKNPFDYPMGPEAQVERWQERLWKFFKIKLDRRSVILPRQRGRGFQRIIINPEGLLLSDVLQTLNFWMSISHDVSWFDNLIVKEDRSNKFGTYAIRVHDILEPDERNEGRTAQNYRTGRVRGQTPIEYALHALCVFDELGQHLDSKTITLCSGAITQSGQMLGFRWTEDPRMLNVDLYSPESACCSPITRARSVITAYKHNGQ